MKQGSFAPVGLCCLDHRHYYDPLRLPLGRLPLPGITGYRQGCFPPPQDGAEEDLSSSKDNPVTVPRPLRREVPRHRLQDQRCRPWPSPFRNRLGSSLSDPKGGPRVTTLQASLHVADWSLAPPRFAPHLSMTHGGLTTGDLGVSPNRTHTGWLPSASRSVTSRQPPCRHGAQTAGRTPGTRVRPRRGPRASGKRRSRLIPSPSPPSIRQRCPGTLSRQPAVVSSKRRTR